MCGFVEGGWMAARDRKKGQEMREVKREARRGSRDRRKLSERLCLRV